MHSIQAQVKFFGLDEKVEQARTTRRDGAEIQLAKCLEVYNQALHLQQKGSLAEARDLYEDLLASEPLKADIDIIPNVQASPLNALQFAVFKNYADLLEVADEKERATQYRIKALNVDPSDSALWYSLGKLAVADGQGSLAIEAFAMAASSAVLQRQKVDALKGLADAKRVLGLDDPSWANLVSNGMKEPIAVAEPMDVPDKPGATEPDSPGSRTLHEPTMAYLEPKDDAASLGMLLSGLFEASCAEDGPEETALSGLVVLKKVDETMTGPSASRAESPTREASPWTPGEEALGEDAAAEGAHVEDGQAEAAEDGGPPAGSGVKQNEGSENNDSEEDGDAQSADNKVRRSTRRARGQDEKSGVVPAVSAGAPTPGAVIDETAAVRFTELLERMMPNSYSPDSKKGYLESVIDRFLDVALGGWRRRGKRTKADTGPTTLPNKVARTNVVSHASNQHDGVSFDKMLDDMAGRPLADWMRAFVEYCVSSGDRFNAAGDRFEDLYQATVAVLQAMASNGFANGDTAGSPEFFLSACELLFDEVAHQVTEQGGDILADEKPAYCAFSAFLSKMLLLAKEFSGTAAVRLHWLLARARFLEGMLEYAEVEFRRCLEDPLLQSGDWEHVISFARQDRTISRATVAAKLRGIEFRRHLESVSDLFRIRKHGEVARLLEPLVTGNEESIDVDQRVSGSYGASDVDEFCSNEERIELFEMFATTCKEAGRVEESWMADMELLEELLRALAMEGATLETLSKVVDILGRILLFPSAELSRILESGAGKPMLSCIFLCNRLVFEMLARWPEFVPSVLKPSADKKGLRLLSQSFITRSLRLLYIVAQEHGGSKQGDNVVTEWLQFSHHLLGLRQICGSEDASFLNLALRHFQSLGSEFREAEAQCYQCLYGITINPEFSLESHGSQVRSLDKSSVELVTAMVPIWLETAAYAKVGERQELFHTLDTITQAIGEQWTESPHMVNNTRQIEQFLDSAISTSECRGDTFTLPLLSVSELKEGTSATMEACSRICSIQGRLLLPQYDATRGQYLDWADAIEKAIPYMLKTLAFNPDEFEQWWMLGVAYAHLAWNLLSQENGTLFRSEKNNIALYQRRAFHALAYSLHLLPSDPDQHDTIFRPSPFPFHPKTVSLDADVFAHIGLLIASILSAPMRGMALAPGYSVDSWQRRYQDENTAVNGGILQSQVSKDDMLAAHLPNVMRTFAIKCFRGAREGNNSEWQFHLAEAKFLAKLQRPHSLILEALSRALSVQPPLSSRTKPSILDPRLALLSYLAKTLLKGTIPMSEVHSALRLLQPSTAAPRDREEALRLIYLELERVRKLDLDVKGKQVYRVGFKAVYRMAMIESEGFGNPAQALAVLSPLLHENCLLRAMYKSGAAWPASLLRSTQAILTFQVSLWRRAGDGKAAWNMLEKISKTRIDQETAGAELFDADGVWKMLYNFCFEEYRQQDPFGKDFAFAPVNPGMATAFGKSITRSQFERLAPSVEALVRDPATADPVFVRRLELLSKLSDLMGFRDGWHAYARHLVADTEEDSDVDRMAVTIYTWMWRMVNVDGSFDHAEEKGMATAEEKKGADPKLRFKWVARRVPVFVKAFGNKQGTNKKKARVEPVGGEPAEEGNAKQEEAAQESRPPAAVASNDGDEMDMAKGICS